MLEKKLLKFILAFGCENPSNRKSEIGDKIIALQGESEATEKRLALIEDKLISDGDITALASAAKKLEQKKKALATELERLQQEAVVDDARNWRECKEFISASIDRLTLRQAIANVVGRIVLTPIRNGRWVNWLARVECKNGVAVLLDSQQDYVTTDEQVRMLNSKKEESSVFLERKPAPPRNPSVRGFRSELLGTTGSRDFRLHGYGRSPLKASHPRRSTGTILR